MSPEELREDPFASLETVIATQTRDMGHHRRDAWAWGIVLGWDDALDEICAKHGWDADTRARLERLRARYVEAREQWRHGCE